MVGESSAVVGVKIKWYEVKILEKVVGGHLKKVVGGQHFGKNGRG